MAPLPPPLMRDDYSHCNISLYRNDSECGNAVEVQSANRKIKLVKQIYHIVSHKRSDVYRQQTKGCWYGNNDKKKFLVNFLKEKKGEEQTQTRRKC